MEAKYSELVSSKYSKELLSFYRIMTNRFPLSNNEDLGGKLNSLSISEIPTSIKEVIIKGFKDNPCGFYPENNKILLINPDKVKEYHIYHELLHMFSTYKNNETIYCGFSQNNRKTMQSIGNGLNEGYTQVLKERYFDTDTNEQYYYMLEKHLAKQLEVIVGRRTMERLYADGDLLGLINKLEKYTNRNDIYSFIYNLDDINKNINNENYVDHINLKLKYSLMFLLNTYINKQSLLSEKGLLDDKNFKNSVEKYLELLANPLYYKGNEYQGLSYEDVEFILYSHNLMPDRSR